MSHQALHKSAFLNVDLRIYSKSDLQPLVAAMGKKIVVLYVGRERRMHKAQLELAIGHPKSPESAIRKYCELIRQLPVDARELWDTAKSRELDIGIEAPGSMRYYWFSVAPMVTKAASEIGAVITVTVYGPMKKAKIPGKSRKPVAAK